MNEFGTIRCIDCGETTNLMSVQPTWENTQDTFLVCQQCYENEHEAYGVRPLKIKRPELA